MENDMEKTMKMVHKRSRNQIGRSIRKVVQVVREWTKLTSKFAFADSFVWMDLDDSFDTPQRLLLHYEIHKALSEPPMELGQPFEDTWAADGEWIKDIKIHKDIDETVKR